MNLTARCKSCGAAIIWAVHKTTKRPAPLDAAPSPIGTILVENGQYWFPDAASRLAYPNRLHTNHHATCTANRWKPPSGPLT